MNPAQSADTVCVDRQALELVIDRYVSGDTRVDDKSQLALYELWRALGALTDGSGDA